jgi:hypothetical protein
MPSKWNSKTLEHAVWPIWNLLKFYFLSATNCQDLHIILRGVRKLLYFHYTLFRSWLCPQCRLRSQFLLQFESRFHRRCRWWCWKKLMNWGQFSFWLCSSQFCPNMRRNFAWKLVQNGLQTTLFGRLSAALQLWVDPLAPWWSICRILVITKCLVSYQFLLLNRFSCKMSLNVLTQGVSIKEGNFQY